MAPDTYHNYAQLAAHEQEGVDYVVRVLKGDPLVAIVTPHGGEIEAGTSEIATAVASEDWSLYCFEGIKATGNQTLHITSTHFDEPRCLALLAPAERVLTIHGLSGNGKVIWIGGKDENLIVRLDGSLKAAGFTTIFDNSPKHGGDKPNNICNRGSSGEGRQLELSRGLRRTLFASLSKAGRQHPTPRLFELSEAIRSGLAGYCQTG